MELFEGFSVGDVVDEEDNDGVAVENLVKGTEFFLAGGVPYQETEGDGFELTTVVVDGTDQGGDVLKGVLR